MISVGSKVLDTFSLTGGRCFFFASSSLPSLLGVIVGLAEIFLDGQFQLPEARFFSVELKLTLPDLL